MGCESIRSTNTYHRAYYPLSILVEIQQILSSRDPVKNSESDDTIDRRLDDFLLQYRV
jgi:hypothetical protein